MVLLTEVKHKKGMELIFFSLNFGLVIIQTNWSTRNFGMIKQIITN